MLFDERVVLPRVGTPRGRGARGRPRSTSASPVIIAGFGRFGEHGGPAAQGERRRDDRARQRLRPRRAAAPAGPEGLLRRRHAPRPAARGGRASTRGSSCSPSTRPEKNLELVADGEAALPAPRASWPAPPTGATPTPCSRRASSTSTARRSTPRCAWAWTRCACSASAATRRAGPPAPSSATTRSRSASSRSCAGDRARYFSVARGRIEELERALLADLEDAADTRDLGWDAESLREDVLRGGLGRPASG